MSLPPEVPQPVDRPGARPEPNDQLQQIEREMTGFERATLRWAIVAVIMSGLAALFVCLQWWEIHKGGQDTHTLAQAADTQAKKMTTMSDAAEKIRQAAEGMVTQDQRIADNAQKALDASNKQGKAALDAAIAASRLDQRAWVGIVSISPFELKAGEKMHFSVMFKNSGKSPAVDFSSVVSVTSFKKGEPFSPRSTDIPTPPSIDVLQPNMEVQASTPDWPTPLTVGDIAAVRAGYIRVYIYGKLAYRDIFRKMHHSTFCAYVEETLKSVRTCETYNEAD